jgi:hypothetical protein
MAGQMESEWLFIFLHNKSKLGSQENTLARVPYIFALKDMIEYGKNTSRDNAGQKYSEK